MRIQSSMFLLLAGSLYITSCSPVKEMAVKKEQVPDTHTSASAYTEPDLTEFLQLFSDEAGGEEVERDFVEGCTQMMRGNLEEALTYFEKVLEADPDNHPAKYNSARIYHEQKDYEKAVELGQQALDAKPDNYWYHKFLVRALGSKGDIKRAILAQQAIVAGFPKKTADRMDLVDLYLKNGQQADGLKVLNQLEKEKGINSMISLRKYELYKSANNFDEALATIQSLIQSGETSPAIYHRQFETLQKLGRAEEAAQSLEALLDIDPDNGYALLTLADYYKRQDQISKSDGYLFRAFSNANIDPQGKIRIIEQLIPYSQTTPSVKERLDRLVKIFNETHPNMPETLILAGKMGNGGTNQTANLDNYREALEKNPQQTDLWLALLEQSYQRKDFQQLNADAELALEYYPNQSQFLYYYGKSSSVLEDYAAANYSFNKLKKIAADDPLLSAQAYLELGGLYKKQSISDKAQENLEQANKLILKLQELSPDDSQVFELLGDYYALTQVPELAEVEWNKAIQKGANFTVKDKMEFFGYKNE